MYMYVHVCTNIKFEVYSFIHARNVKIYKIMGFSQLVMDHSSHWQIGNVTIR